MHIIQHLNMDRKFPYNIHHIKLSKRLLLYLEVQIYIQLLIETADTEHWMKRQLAYASRITCLGFLLRGNTNTQCTVAEGQLVKTNTHTDTFPAAPTLSEEWRDSRYWYLYLYKNKQNCNSINKLKAKQPKKKTHLKRMVTVHEWVDRAVHGGIVFTLGPGCPPRRMWGRQTRWREADSLAAARPPLGPPPNWTSSAAGRPDRCLQTLRLTCGTQADRAWAAGTFLLQSRCWQTLTCHCWLMSTLALWALPLCSSCSSSSVWLCHCLISHWVLLSSLDRTI